MKRLIFRLVFILLCVVIVIPAIKIQLAKAEPTTITVPDDYPTIQAAINAANPGDTVYVRNGIYQEHIEINKPITLMGESNQNTIIEADSSGWQWCGINVTASNVTVENFNITSGVGPFGSGVICVNGFSDDVIRNNYISSAANAVCDTFDIADSSGNIVENNQIAVGNQSSSGIGVISDDNTVFNNTVLGGWTCIAVIVASGNNVSDNYVSGQTLSGGFSDIGAICLLLTSNDAVVGNTLINNELGLSVNLGTGCSVYHNNFINNTQQALTENGSQVLFDDGYPSGGNYWSDYQTKYPNATEIDSSGIWNTPYVIDTNNVDHYPLMNPFSTSPFSVTISPSSATLDVGQSQLFTSTISGGTLPYSYQWYLNGSAVTGANFSNWTFTPSSSNLYNVYVNVTDNTGFVTESNTAIVTVNPPPSISVSPTSVVMDVGQSTLFTSTVAGGTSPYSYQWYLNNSPVSGATNITWTFTPSSIGSYTVYVSVTDAVNFIAESNTAIVTVDSYVIVTNITANAWIYQGTTANINVTVSNIGGFPENAWVTLYYNTTAGKSIDAYPVNLGPGQSYTLVFSWNTASVPCLNYTLTAVATIPTSSNTLSGVTITVRLLGDVNGDGRVDMKDIAIIARALGSTPTSTNWNPAADILGVGVVNMKDVALVARNFGKHYP